MLRSLSASDPSIPDALQRPLGDVTQYKHIGIDGHLLRSHCSLTSTQTCWLLKHWIPPEYDNQLLRENCTANSGICSGSNRLPLSPEDSRMANLFLLHNPCHQEQKIRRTGNMYAALEILYLFQGSESYL